MEPLDVVKHVGLGDIQRRVLMAVDAFALEHPEEAFAGRVVAAMADGTHRTQQRVLLQEPLVVAALELTAAVRMQNGGALALPLPDRHLDSPDHHLPILPVMHRPADDELAEQVEHDAQVQLAFVGLEFGDVGHPLGIRLQSREVALEVVGDVGCGLTRPTTHPAPLLPRPALKPVLRHQPRNPVQAGDLPFGHQILLHARCADRLPAVLMQFTDTAEQSRVIHVAGAWQALLPRVIAAGRHPQAPTHQTNRKVTAATPDRLILQDDSLAKNVAASRKKSRSFFTRASSRLSLASSSSRAVPVPTNAGA